MNGTGNLQEINLNGIYLLPGFDEYLLGYTDRTTVLKAMHTKQVMGTGNGIFSSTKVIKGRVAGTWKRSFVKGKVLIETRPFLPSGIQRKHALALAAGRYCQFLGMEGVDYLIVDTGSVSAKYLYIV